MKLSWNLLLSCCVLERILLVNRVQFIILINIYKCKSVTFIITMSIRCSYFKNINKVSYSLRINNAENICYFNNIS